MVARIGICDDDVSRHFDRVEVDMFRHLHETFRTECVFGVDVQGGSLKSSLFDGALYIHAELMADLAFTASKLTIKLCNSLSLQSTAKEVINSSAPSTEPVNVLSLFEEFVSSDECDVDGATSEADNIQSLLLTDACALEFPCSRCGQRLDCVEPQFF